MFVCVEEKTSRFVANLETMFVEMLHRHVSNFIWWANINISGFQSIEKSEIVYSRQSTLATMCIEFTSRAFKPNASLQLELRLLRFDNEKIETHEAKAKARTLL